MNTELEIDPQLAAVKSHALPDNRWALGALQTVLRAVNALHRRRFKHVLTKTWIPSLDGHRVRTLIIRPPHARPALPALVYFHGGAFVMEGAPAHVENAVRYAAQAPCVVLYVEYRLAPQHVFPAGFDDCYAVLKWTIAHAAELGIDAACIAVGGDSAGGNLAAGVAQRAHQEGGVDLRGQLLIYPAVDLLCTRPSMNAYKDVPPFKDISATGIAATYLGRVPLKPLPLYASPIEGMLQGLAPAYVETPQFDPLHDQGIAYAKLLRAKGVEVELNDIPGAIHGFDVLAPKSGIADGAMARRIRFLQRVFA